MPAAPGGVLAPDELVQVKFQGSHHSVYGGRDDDDDDEKIVDGERIFDSEKIFDSSRTSFGTCPLLSQHVH